MSNDSQAARYAAQFEVVSNELIATVADCSDQGLRSTTTSEGWPVVVVAHHMAEVYGFFNGVVERSTTSDAQPMSFTTANVNQNNARHARESADVSRAETLELLKANQAALIDTLQGVDDEQLDRTAVVVDGNPLSVSLAIELGIIAHIREHLASIRATLAA